MYHINLPSERNLNYYDLDYQGGDNTNSEYGPPMKWERGVITFIAVESRLYGI